MTLPDWYKGYMLANGINSTGFSSNDDDAIKNHKRHIKSMSDRPFEFVYYALKMRPHLLNIINDKILFCLASPDLFFRKL